MIPSRGNKSDIDDARSMLRWILKPDQNNNDAGENNDREGNSSDSTDMADSDGSDTTSDSSTDNEDAHTEAAALATVNLRLPPTSVHYPVPAYTNHSAASLAPPPPYSLLSAAMTTWSLQTPALPLAAQLEDGEVVTDDL
jgi:hypothetical protein